MVFLFVGLIIVGNLHADERPIRIGLTPVILEDQLRFLESWRRYLEQELGREVQFLRRNSYGEIVDLALRGQVDFAWLCGFPYVRNEGALDLLAAPVFKGAPRYQSYLIVPASDTETRDLMDLEGGIFAFSDPNSNSGWLYPEAVLRRHATSAERHFERTFYTWGHRRVIEAVAHGLAEGGAVDGYVWETLARVEPELTGRTRIVNRSDAFGFPPVVATPAADPATRQAVLEVLLSMDESERGRQLLEALNLDGFQQVEPELYDSIRRLSREVVQ
ncbi:MAG: PhnD/SsuA/transferrin family substrate-binding protein [Ectothiorhodospiraceae bacterium]|nr:PhnD/SsuA/transferrin family substrate-binding protein [Ectothiorhodospiraceae bacterium]MCH8506335.1 PhnD/SsuA/transferrin family substrate-binding protein [Ectothiorhodospiraceae bacterium]